MQLYSSIVLSILYETSINIATKASFLSYGQSLRLFSKKTLRTPRFLLTISGISLERASNTN